MAGNLEIGVCLMKPPVTGTANFRPWNQHTIFSSITYSCFGSHMINQNSSILLPPPKLHLVSSTTATPASIICRNSKISHQGNDHGDHPLKELIRPNFLVSSATDDLLKFAASNFTPLVLTGGVAFALANPSLGCLAHRYQLSKFSMIGLFLITGLTLRNREIGEATEAWPAGLFGLASILLLTPLLSRIMMQLHLQPLLRLALYNCMPTAISSGVALTKLAGGNSALALALTVSSSIIGVLIVPFSISKLIGSGVLGTSVPANQMFKNLVVTLLIPLILGKALRESFKGVADIVDSNSKLLSAMGAILLSLIPWMQVSKSRPLLLMVKPGVGLVAVLLGVLLHLVLLCFNAILIQMLSVVPGGGESTFAKKETYITVLLVASQKTVSMLVAVVDQLGDTFGEAGLLVLPCVAAHISQVIIDSILVGFWNKRKINTC